MANEPQAMSWRSVGRIVAAMALAAGAWLLLIPTAATDGTSCGVPVFNTDADDAGFSSLDCDDRNGVRVTQAIWTIVVGGGWLAASAFRRWTAEVDAQQASEPTGRVQVAMRAQRMANDRLSAPVTRAEHDQVLNDPQ